MNSRNVVIGVIVSALAAGVVISCGGGGGGGGGTPAAAPTNTVRSATLSGANESTPVVTAATGVGAVVVDPTTMAITGGITISGLTATGLDIYQAPLGNPTGDGASIVVLNPVDANTATVPANTTLSAAQYTALLAGELYFQVRTGANPSGEIRGPISGATGLVAGVASMNGAQEVPVSAVATTGKGTVVVNSSTRQVLIGYMTHNVTNADLAHIHGATGPGTNGGITVGFQNVSGTITTAPAGAIMTPTDFANLTANYSYFNIHSTADGFPNGEIRGDIVVQVLP